VLKLFLVNLNIDCQQISLINIDKSHCFTNF